MSRRHPNPLHLSPLSAQRLGLHWLIAILILALLLPTPGAAQTETPTGPTPPTANPVLSLASAPGNPAQVLAGTLNTPDPSTIFRSEDGGATWERSGTGLRQDISIADIAYDPANPALVLAADGGFGYLFRSTDGGRTWSETPAFKALIGPNSAVGELYAATVNGVTTFYAGTRFDGVLTSTDGGQTWQSTANGLAGDARRVRSFQLFNDVIYAGTHDGVYALDAATATWSRANNFPVTTVAYSMADQAGTLYVGTINFGLWSSPDGLAWVQVAGFPPSATVFDLASAGTGLVIATDAGVWSGSGEQWLQASVDTIANNNPVYSLAATNGTVYAGSAVDWVLRTDDRGFSFRSIATIPPMAATASPVLLPTPTPAVETAPPPSPEATPGPEEELLDIDVPGAPAQATVVAEEPTAAPLPAQPTAAPLPEETAPTPAPQPEAPAPAAPDSSPGSQPEGSAAAQVVQLPPIVVGASLLLLLVIVVAGFAVLRGPRNG